MTAQEMTAPNLFGLPPGARFALSFADGLIVRHGQSGDPAALARVEVLANSARMARSIRDALEARGVRLLPRIRLVDDLARDTPMKGLAPAVPALRRRMEVARLVAELHRQRTAAGGAEPFPRSAIFELAGGLAALMEEMHREGVGPDDLEALDVSEHSEHWQRSLAFVKIVRGFFDSLDAPDSQQRLNCVVAHLAARWAERGPDHPLIVAGSTGSRAPTALLMRALAAAPNGAVVLPGFDFDLPGRVWDAMTDALTFEDHPQFRFRRLLDAMEARPGDVGLWLDRTAPDLPERLRGDGLNAPDPARNRLISLALRPAPVTDQWRREGPDLGDLREATEAVTLVEAPSPRLEALAIALRLRQAAVDGRRAALVTPDRTLGRMVTAALARWGITPDDSAGIPLNQTPPGRLMRQVARLRAGWRDVESLLALLKHPLVHSGGGRGDHARRVSDLELHWRRHGPPYPEGAHLADWARERDDPGCGAWCDWLGAVLDEAARPASALADHVRAHLALAERLAGGAASGGPGGLWDREQGILTLRAAQAILAEAAHAAPMDAADYAAFFDAELSAAEGPRRPERVSDHVLIWGTLEARAGGLDLAILGGLNDGVWPEAPPADPWMNRRMRHAAGLTLPERVVGLSAHDFQQATGATQVWFSRAVRNAEAETVPSRWLNRIGNLVRGLPERGGPEAWEAMKKRGDRFLAFAEAMDRAPAPVDPEPRPAPCPPVAARPTRFSPSLLHQLRRDPYAVYARKVLRLEKLPPIRPEPDAMLRGQVLHDAFERFVREGLSGDAAADRARLLAIAEEEMVRVDWPADRRLWLGRLGRVADWFVASEAARRAIGTPVAMEAEARGEMQLPTRIPVTLTARADRIDRTPDGRLIVYDYKTGSAPSKESQRFFDRQLLIEAMMIEAGAFGDDLKGPVAAARYVVTGASPGEVDAPLDDIPPARVRDELVRLIDHYLDAGTGFAARLAPASEEQDGDYDHLARRGEWEVTTPHEIVPVGRPGPGEAP